MITLYSQPAAFTPAYNEQWFVAFSSQIAATGFKYRIVITDLITNESITEDVDQMPNGKLEFNAQFLGEMFIENYIPVNVYGFKVCFDAIRKIRVNIGEYYSGSPPYVPGTDVEYIIWNASLNLLDLSNYNYSDHIYDSYGSPPSFNFLNCPATMKTYEDRSNYLYVIWANQNDFPQIAITAYDSGGNILAQSFIANPYTSDASYFRRYLAIDIGKKGLDNIASGLVTGSYPVLPTGTSYYTVEDVNIGTITTVTIKCSEFEVYTLHYLDKFGKYNTLHCSKVTELSSEKEVTTFKKNPWVNVNNTMTLDYSALIEQTQSSIHTDKIRVNSDWLTQAELTMYKDLFASSDVRLDLGSAQGYLSVKLTNGGYTELNNRKQRQLTFDLQVTHSNHRQRG